MLTPNQYLAKDVKLQAGDIIVGKNASKAASITSTAGQPITLLFQNCTSPFGLSTWGGDDASKDRVSLDLRASPTIESCVTKIDEAILKYVEANASKYFPANLTKDRIREYFRPTLKIHEENKYPALIKTKLSKSRVKVWDTAKKTISADAIEPHSNVSVVLTVRALYFQSKSWGIVLECQHVMLAENSAECPFECDDAGDAALLADL